LQRRVTVHLLTDDFPSTNDHVPGASRPNFPDHFAAFLAEAWQPRAADQKYPLPERWSHAWAALATASGLERNEFETFTTNCRFDVGYRLPDDVVEESDAQREGAAWKADLDQLHLALYSIVADKRQIVQLSRSDLLDLLGWRERLEFRSRHEFPPTPIPYEEITGTAQELFDAIHTKTGGYLILLGTPGSGKSTLLSHALRYRSERVVRYYAYVPDTLEPSSTRGEAINFLHDMVLALEQLGIRSGQTIIKNDLQLLAARLLQQLQQLHHEFVQTGQKTILVIDGLDHIGREQAPTRSLLRELPLPNQVPEGVYIVLGSQTDHLQELPTPVRVTIDEPSRCIQMRLLSPVAVQSIVDRTALTPSPSAEQVGRIFELSNGHPLALGYVINQLRIGSEVDVDTTLSKIEPYRDHIDVQYVSHWRQVEDDRALVHLLALLARIRGGIDIRWVEEWANKDALYHLQRRFKHYFRIESDSRWYFFHNSFRAFLTEQTRRLPGVSSAVGDATLFTQLATYSAAAHADSAIRWDELYYRAAAQDHAGAKRLTDPAQIRAQFLAGRSIQSIRADIRKAYASAGATTDLVLLARLCLLSSEYNLRESNLEEAPITEMLLALGDDRVAVDRLREGLQLRVSPGEALRASIALLAAGLEDEAERIFTLAEPLDILSRATPIPSHERDETVRTVKDWIGGAIHFRSVDQIIVAIDRLHIDEAPSAFQHETTESLHRQLRFELVRSLVAARRWDDALSVYSEWAEEEDGGYWFWSQVHVWREASHLGEPDRALAAIDATRNWAETHLLDAHDRIALAEAVLRLRGDAAGAAALIAGVQQPALADGMSAPVDAEFQPFRFRFQLNRLLSALGQERPLRECVPDAAESREEGLVLFERQVCIVARLFGRAWAGRTMPAQIFVNEALGVLRLFNRPYPHEWTTWYLAQAGRTELYRLLVRAASLHGAEVVAALTDALEQEWDDAGSKMYWPPDVVREVVTALWEAGASAAWTHRRLIVLEPDLFADDEIRGRLKSAQAQFDAYVSVRDLQSARQVYTDLLKASLGVGYKDYQVIGLLRWVELANREDPASGASRLAAAASFMPPLEGTHAEWDSLKEVVRAACKWSLAAGLRVIEWLFDHARLRYDVALRILLEEALDRPGEHVAVADAVYRWLLLPFDSEAHPDLLVLLAERLSRPSTSDAVAIVARLSASVRTYALPSTRGPLLKTLSSVHGGELDRSFATSDIDESTTSTPITYDIDGEKLTESEVTERAVSVEAIRRLVATARESFLRWERILEPFVRQATYAEVQELAGLFGDSKRSSMAYALFARRLAALDRRQESVRMAERAFELTEPSGWHEYLDGGTRLRVLEALRIVDGERAQRIGFETLINELTAGTADGGPLAVELSRILPLLTDAVPAGPVWEEVRWYLEALFAHAGNLQGPSLGDLIPGDPHDLRGASWTLCRWIMQYFDDAANALARSAQRAAIELLEKRDQTVQALVGEYLDGDPTELALITLRAAAMEDAQVIASFADRFAKLTAARHFGVRRQARQLLDALAAGGHGGTTAATPAPSELPAAYDLTYQQRRSARRIVNTPIRSEEFLPPSDDPAELISPWNPEAGAIAKLANVQPEALYQRTAELMAELGGPNFDREELELRRRLDRLELKLGFRRPRAALARKALGVATAELVDAGRIPDAAFDVLDTLLCAGDPATLRQLPKPRPAWITSIAERADGTERGHYNAGWESRASTGQSATLAPAERVDGVIIAEESHLRWLQWERPEEVRLGAIVGGVPPTALLEEDDPLRKFCVEWPHDLVSDYPRLRGDSRHLAGLQNGYRFETPGNRWLAFNPSVALSLGWVLDAHGLFRWIDAFGGVMVESLLWQDGLYEHQPPKFDDEVGWGWLVRASQPGWKAIVDAYDVRSRAICVMRKSNKVSWHRATALSPA
jgi:hypothetical protein